MTRAVEWTWFAVRAFVGTAVPFGLAVGLVLGRTSAGIEAGAGFGVIMTTAFVSMTIRSGRRRGRVDLTTRCRTDVPVAATDDLPQRLRAAMAALPATIVADDGKVVRARTGVTLRSWGESITAEYDPSASTVSIESRPRLRSTLADYGRNRDNVERLVASLGPAPAATR